MRFTIRPAVTLAPNGAEKRYGYDLFIDGEWHERFRLRREAKAEMHRLARNESLARVARR